MKTNKPTISELQNDIYRLAKFIYNDYSDDESDEVEEYVYLEIDNQERIIKSKSMWTKVVRCKHLTPSCDQSHIMQAEGKDQYTALLYLKAQLQYMIKSYICKLDIQKQQCVNIMNEF